MRAQQMHPESQKLYLTFFQIELENKRKADVELALQHATIVYTNGKKKFPKTFNYYVNMLEMVDKFDYAEPIQTMIIDDMGDIFRKEDILWHTFAQRELVGLSTSDFREKVRRCSQENGYDADVIDHHLHGADDYFKMTLDMIKVEENVPLYIRKRIEYAVQIYEESVKVVSGKQNERSNESKKNNNILLIKLKLKFNFIQSVVDPR